MTQSIAGDVRSHQGDRGVVSNVDVGKHEHVCVSTVGFIAHCLISCVLIFLLAF